MIIQKIITPFRRLQEWQQELYIRGKRFTYQEDCCFNILPTGFIQTDTFFNSLSICKLHTYTNIDNLSLHIVAHGEYRLIVKNTYAVKLDITDRVIFNEICNNEKIIDLSQHLNLSGSISIYLQAITNVFVSEIYFESEQNVRPIKIGLAVCTFRREPYIKRLLEDFKKYSPLNCSLFISDNASSLSLKSSDNVFIFKNKNFGGVGGFTRCILEINKKNKINYEYTHTLLMDDDILIDLRILERLSSLLSIIKESYQSYFITGSMFNLDNPNIQTEIHSIFNGTNNFRSYGYGDMFSYKEIILNEVINDHREEQCTSGWWFNCIPMNVIKDNNYPFPCFFRGDDIEYSFRNRSKSFSIAGLSVWHEPFYKKYTNTAENYYLPRNLMVIDTLYRKNGLAEMISYLDQRFEECITQYNYNGASLIILAMNHYLQGTSFFEKTNPEELNNELGKYNYKLINIEDVFGEYSFRDLIWESEHKDESSKKLIRKLNKNGYLIPVMFFKQMGFSYFGFAGKAINFYKIKKVFNLDPFSKKGFFTEIDKKKYRELKASYNTTKKKLLLNYTQIKKEYSLNFNNITSKEFWIRYLQLENDSEY